MRVSIITVCFNSASTIIDTIKSVKAQLYPNIEHIIIDGCSQDNTLEIITTQGHTGPLISEKDDGLYDAMNKGISLATGDVIGILNSDDFYCDAKVIEDVVNLFEKNNCDAVYADLNYIDITHQRKVVRRWKSGKFRYKKFNYGWMPPHPTLFIKKECYIRMGGFNTELKSAADYELILRFLYKNKTNVFYLPRVVVNMRAGGMSNSSLKNRIKAHLEDYQAWNYNGITPRWYTLMLKPLRKIFQYI